VPGARLATLDDLDLLARVAAAGFYDDPVMRWVLPDDGRRLGQLAIMFRGLAEDTLPDRGVVHLAADASAAFWRRPDFEHGRMASDRLEDSGDTAPEGRGPFDPDEVARLEVLGDAMRTAHPREPHWYLNVVATVPTHQGRGLGATVLRPVLEEADALGMPCYLESTNPRNRTLYYRQGFVDMGELPLDGGPTMLQMWREPRR
jgi:GNAT superfamily N-acetyltransferase